MLFKRKIKRILLLVIVQLTGINMGMAGAYCSGTCTFKTDGRPSSTVVHGRGPTERDAAMEIHQICSSRCETYKRNTECHASEIGCTLRTGVNPFSMEPMINSTVPDEQF